MDIKTENKQLIAGKYQATVRVGRTTIVLEGAFELPDYGSQSSLDLALESQIRQQIGITIDYAEVPTQPKG